MHDNDSLMPDSFEVPRAQGGAKSPDEAIIGPAFTLMDAGLLGAPRAAGPAPASPFEQAALEPVPEPEPLRMPVEEPYRRRSRDEWSMLDEQYPYPAGGGAASVVALNIQEQDGSPNVAVTTIKVPNGTLTDEGNGVVSLSFSSTLQQAYNNGSAGVDILTDGTRLGVTLRRGSAADTDTVFSVQNGAGTDRLVMRGDGTLMVGEAVDYTGIILARSDNGDNQITTAPAILALINEDMNNDNHVLIEYAGKGLGGVKTSFGKSGVRIISRNGLFTEFVWMQILSGTKVETLRLGANISTSDASLYINGISQYACALGAGKNSSDTGVSTAIGQVVLVNEDMTNDNWMFLEYGGKSTIGSRVSFGRIGVQVKNHNFGNLQSDIVIAPVTNSGITERVRISGLNEGAITTYPGTGGTFVINENGADADFRVEGDTDVNCLFLDASVDRIGIGTNTPQVKLDVNGGIATRATTNATITADQNDYAIGGATFFRLATDAQRTITGLTGGVDGKLLVIRNTGSFNLVLAHGSGSSSAANRILTGTGQDVVVPPDAAAILIYDATTQRWQMV